MAIEKSKRYVHQTTRLRRAKELRPIRRMPELYQVVIECRDEAQQRELFERLKTEGVRVRLHVL